MLVYFPEERLWELEGRAEAVPASFLARSAKATARIAIARISRSDPTNSIGARDVIEDVEDRINGFAAEVRFAQPFRTWNAELDKLEFKIVMDDGKDIEVLARVAHLDLARPAYTAAVLKFASGTSPCVMAR